MYFKTLKYQFFLVFLVHLKQRMIAMTTKNALSVVGNEVLFSLCLIVFESRQPREYERKWKK